MYIHCFLFLPWLLATLKEPIHLGAFVYTPGVQLGSRIQLCKSTWRKWILFHRPDNEDFVCTNESLSMWTVALKSIWLPMRIIAHCHEWGCATLCPIFDEQCKNRSLVVYLNRICWVALLALYVLFPLEICYATLLICQFTSDRSQAGIVHHHAESVAIHGLSFIK